VPAIEPDRRRKSPGLQLTPRGQIPIVPAAPPSDHPPPRFRALALFGRRPPERVARSSLPASENLHTSRHMQRSKIHAYSITSSAVASSVGGTVRLSIRAVWALMTSSNLVGCTTGMSAGFSPLRMRPR
jgi:hypothetical protein